MAYKLLIDKRERDVLKHESEFADIYYDTKQMEIADYIIMKGDEVKFAIERKSWNDFAASIKDGRHNNKAKMMALRTQTGCKVFYIVEGALIGDPNRQVSRIPYRVLESAMFHMQVRDDIHIIRTSSTLDTAKTLVRFIRSLGTLKDAPKHDHQQGLVEGAGADGIPLALTQRIAKASIDVVRELWSGFRSITASSADYLIEQYSVADFIRGDVADIPKIKFSNGRTINKPMARSLGSITHTVEIRLLGKIPLVSADTAKELLRSMRLKTLLSYGEEGIAMQTVKGRKIGLAKARNIIKYFNYKKGNEGDDGDDGDDNGDSGDSGDNGDSNDGDSNNGDNDDGDSNDGDDNGDNGDDSGDNGDGDGADSNDGDDDKPTVKPKRAIVKKPIVKPKRATAKVAAKVAVKRATVKPTTKKPTAKRATTKAAVVKPTAKKADTPKYDYKDDGTIGFDDEL